MSGETNTTQNPSEQRKYVRLKTVFPVDFTIVRLQTDLPGVEWLRGYTDNVSQGGMCLETSDIRESLVNYLFKENIYLELKIHVPLSVKPVRAVGELAWKEKSNVEGTVRFKLGLKFHSITKPDLNTIMSFAHGLNWTARGGVVGSIVIFVTLLAYLIFHNLQALF